MSATSYAPAELMKLRQPKTLSILHHDHRSIRHIDTNLDNCCRHQDLDLILCKCSHDLVFFCLFHPPMKRSDPDLVTHLTLQKLRIVKNILCIHCLALFYHRTNHIALSSFGDLLLHKAVSSRSVTGIHHTVLDWQTVCRKFINHRNIQISI